MVMFDLLGRGDLNPNINKTSPDASLLLLGQVRQKGRKSTKKDASRGQKSLGDQQKCTQATADRLGLPSTPDDWRGEAAGLAGDLWWSGGGTNGLEDLDAKRKTRPVLTELLKEVIAGKVRCIIVWNVDRLWRDVSICREMIGILFRHDCLLYDFNGPVNIWTYEGRNSLLQNAIASQAVSEAARINSPRGVEANIKEGKLVVSPNVLGFRSAGQRTGMVLHMEEEQALANRIHQMCDQGSSSERIAHQLMDEGIALYAETDGQNPHGNRRVKGNEAVIYTESISAILRDCRYVGRQEHVPSHARDEAKRKGVLLNPRDYQYPCSVFLRPDGSTVVAEDLWNRNQDKLDRRRRTSNRAVNRRALASLVRCGIDGEPLTAQETKMKDGSMVGYWIMRKTRPGCQCKHKLPNVREDTLTAYLLDVLRPLLLAEIGERFGSVSVGDQAAERARLEVALGKALLYQTKGLAAWAREMEPTKALLKQMEADAEADVDRLRREFAEMDVEKSTTLQAAQTLDDLENASEDALRDALRHCLVWVAVFATPSEREAKPDYKTSATRYTYAPTVVGKFVFLTSWGTYHTAVLCRQRDGTHRGTPPSVLRPAKIDEVIGGVADFPRPDMFIGGLADDWEGHVYGWSPAQIAPGYQADARMPMAEFGVCSGDGTTAPPLLMGEIA